MHIILLRTELSVRMGRYMAALVQRGECDEYDDGRRRDEEGRRVDERSHVEERRCDQDGRRVVEACEVLVHALEVLKGQVFDRWEGVAELGVRERMAVLESMSRRPGLLLSRIPKQSNLRRAREGSEG